MAKYGIPTAGFRAFTDYAEAKAYVAARPLPAVLKYDGLAAGKGVVIAQTMEEADAALRDMLLDDKFGAGKVVVEDFLTGPEFSLLCFVSGRKVWPMVLATLRCRSSRPRTSVMRWSGSCGPSPRRWRPRGCRSKGCFTAV